MRREIKNQITIMLNSLFIHPSPFKKKAEDLTDEDIKKMFESTMRKKGGMRSSELNWVDDNTVEVTNFPGLAVHNFVLQMEELGKQVTFERTTKIKIS